MGEAISAASGRTGNSRWAATATAERAAECSEPAKTLAASTTAADPAGPASATPAGSTTASTTAIPRPHSGPNPSDCSTSTSYRQAGSGISARNRPGRNAAATGASSTSRSCFAAGSPAVDDTRAAAWTTHPAAAASATTTSSASSSTASTHRGCVSHATEGRCWSSRPSAEMASVPGNPCPAGTAPFSLSITRTSGFRERQALHVSLYHATPTTRHPRAHYPASCWNPSCQAA